MAIYKFILDHKMYNSFRESNSKFFRSNFVPNYEVQIRTDENDMNPVGVEQLFKANNEYAFKGYKWVPDGIEFDYVKYCWQAQHIKNEEKYDFWKPLLGVLFGPGEFPSWDMTALIKS